MESNIEENGKMLDIERIIQTGIPDIAPVYGGVRGRTMSARHQSYAWPIIREAGVNTYIDLREGDRSNRLPNLCQLKGLEYFHYPVDKHARMIDQMVEHFPQFCEKIDQLLASGYNPKLDDGVGKNIAPLQKAGLISYEVLKSTQLKKYLNADW